MELNFFLIFKYCVVMAGCLHQELPAVLAAEERGHDEPEHRGAVQVRGDEREGGESHHHQLHRALRRLGSDQQVRQTGPDSAIFMGFGGI